MTTELNRTLRGLPTLAVNMALAPRDWVRRHQQSLACDGCPHICRIASCRRELARWPEGWRACAGCGGNHTVCTRCVVTHALWGSPEKVAAGPGGEGVAGHNTPLHVCPDALNVAEQLMEEPRAPRAERPIDLNPALDLALDLFDDERFDSRRMNHTHDDRHCAVCDGLQ